jgi:hypothetical protein
MYHSRCGRFEFWSDQGRRYRRRIRRRGRCGVLLLPPPGDPRGSVALLDGRAAHQDVVVGCGSSWRQYHGPQCFPVRVHVPETRFEKPLWSREVHGNKLYQTVWIVKIEDSLGKVSHRKNIRILF